MLLIAVFDRFQMTDEFSEAFKGTYGIGREGNNCNIETTITVTVNTLR